MATYNSMAVSPTLFAYSQTLTLWPSAADLNVVLGVAPTSIAPVWPPEAEPVVLSFSLFTTPFAAEAVRIVEGESGIAYRMRAYDATLGREVFWNSVGIDDQGSAYGGPGPLSDIVVHMLLGT
jgi:hypothetical protein